MTINKKPKINIHIQEMYDQVKKQGGPTGIFTQSIVDEYHRLVKLESERKLETKKINISFLKKREK
jgi:hypothetical protein